MQLPKIDARPAPALFVASAINLAAYFIYYMYADYAIALGQSNAPSYLFILAAFASNLYIVYQVIQKTVKENPLPATVLKGALFTASLFLTFICVVGLANLLAFPLSPNPYGGYPDPFLNFFTGYQGKLFGCTEGLLFNLTPWFCGNLLRSLADGAIYGTVLFGLASLVLGRKTPSALTTGKKSERANTPTVKRFKRAKKPTRAHKKSKSKRRR